MERSVVKHLCVVALAVAGCNSILGVGDFTTAPTDPDTVTGTSTISYILFDGQVQTGPEDLSKYVIKAYVPDGLGHFEILDGVGRADGTFEIPDVPEGATYYLYLLYPQIPNHPAPIPRFWVTDARTLDLGYHIVGRIDGVEATRASTVSLDATNLAPWTDGDILVVDSYNNGSEFYPLENLVTNGPQAGATSLTGYTFDWRNGYTYHPIGSLPRLVDSAKGDDFFVTHLHEELVNMGTYAYSLVRQVGVLAKNDVTQMDGVPLVVSGAFTPITPDKSIAVTFAINAFRMGFAIDNGRCTDENLFVGRLDNAGTQYQQRIGTGPWLITVPPRDYTLARLPGEFTLSAITFGQSSLFPASWGQNGVAEYHHLSRLRAPGATTYIQSNSYSSLTRPIAGSTFDVGPAIRPVQKIHINDINTLNNTGTIKFDGAVGPTVTWDAVPQVDGYTVDVQRVYNDVGTTRRQIILQARTKTPSFTIPADVLTKGHRYVVGVTSNVGLDAAGLRRLRVPEAASRLFGNLFLYSDSCGDGVTQAELGEECDGMGQTPTCDVDCSLVLCGDTTMNMAAGETCDFGAHALGCDDDCTPVACGDGVFNHVAEVCDDGNADDTDGCTTTCARSGTCGDGTIQSSVEECDPPDGTTCSVECLAL
jgi:cysteine-rich repeat protein